MTSSEIDNLIIDTLRESKDKYPSDGIQLTLFIPSSGYHSHCFGQSKTDTKELIHRETVFGIGSITKLFTAVLYLKLFESIPHNLNSKIRTILNDRFGLKYHHDLEIIHLLKHFSGLGDYTKNDKFWGQCFQDQSQSFDNGEIIEFINQSPVDSGFLEQKYNSSNYFILGVLLQELLGNNSINDVFKSTIFLPSNCSSTFFFEDFIQVKNFPVASDLLKYGRSLFSGAGLGGNIISNSLDLTRFINSIFSFKIISQESIDKMLDFEDKDYGIGIRKFLIADQLFFGHDGVIPDSSGMVFYDLNTKISGAFLTTNSDQQYAYLEFVEKILRQIYIILDFKTENITHNGG